MTDREPNRDVARVVEKYPDKLIGFAVHSPQRETGRLRGMLVEEVKWIGLKGVKSDGHPTRELLNGVGARCLNIMYYPDINQCADLVRRSYTMALAGPLRNLGERFNAGPIGFNRLRRRR